MDYYLYPEGRPEQVGVKYPERIHGDCEMVEIEIKRGYEVLPDNNVRFGIRVINNSDFAISDVEVILDYSESLFDLEGSKVRKLDTIPPAVPRTAKFTLKPLGCVHKEEIAATIRYKDHQWRRHTLEMQPKEVHCVCPFLKEKAITREDFLSFLDFGYLEERGINFEGIAVDKVVDFLYHTCKNRLYRVDEVSIEDGTILYLAGDALGEKAYYLLTAVVKEYDRVTQVLLRANSDKEHGLNGFLNEILDNLRHLVLSAEAREIGIIKKEQVINIIDSVVQKTTFAGGEGAASVNIEGSVVQRTEIRDDGAKRRRVREEGERKERERARPEEERLQREEEERKVREESEKREREEQEKLRRGEEERKRKEKEERERIRREEEEKKERERKARAEREKKAREEAERKKREEEGLKVPERNSGEAVEQWGKEMPKLRGGGISQKKIMAVVLALGVLLVGYWAFAPGSTDAPEPSETVPLPPHTATPNVSPASGVTQTISQTPTPELNIPNELIKTQILTPELFLSGTESYKAADGKMYVRYRLSIKNWNAFPDELFEPAPDLPPCGLNNEASRTWLDIYDSNGDRLYGFCALSAPKDLTYIWFGVGEGDPPPEGVYVLLIDRRENITYRSNMLYL